MYHYGTCRNIMYIPKYDACIFVLLVEIQCIYLNMMNVSLCYMHYVTCRNIMYIPEYDACIFVLHVEI